MESDDAILQRLIDSAVTYAFEFSPAKGERLYFGMPPGSVRVTSITYVDENGVKLEAVAI